MLGLNIRLRVKSKLMVLLLATSIVSVSIISLISIHKGQQVIREIVASELIGVRSAKAQELRHHFEEIRGNIALLCETPSVVRAMLEFSEAFKGLERQVLKEDTEQALRDYYEAEYFPRLAENVVGKPYFDVYRPVTHSARYLQYYYLARSPHPVDERNGSIDVGEGSGYSDVHRRHHPYFEKLLRQFHYEDLYLIDFDSGQIVYSAAKKADFATDLERGPYRFSNLAELVERVRRNPHHGAVHMVDYQFYPPDYGQPKAFLGGPIYHKERIVGILAKNVPTARTDRILSGDGGWQHNGLGESGEVFLVGADLLMRSNSRLLQTDPDEYKEELRENRASPQLIESIDKHGTTVLQQQVDSEAVQEALGGREGNRVVRNYLGEEVLAAYAPISIEGFDWAIIAHMELEEAYEELEQLGVHIFIGTVVIIVLFTFIANFGANRFLSPLNGIVDQLRNAKPDNPDFRLSINTQDEFQELVGVINQMAHNLGQQTRLVQRKTSKIEGLLLNLLPRRLVERVQKGESRFVENIEQATVLAVELRGLSAWSPRAPVAEIADSFGELINLFEEAGRRYDVESFKLTGEQYVAVCGVNSLHLDHSKRVVSFALELVALIDRFNQRHGTDLNPALGIHKGYLQVAVVTTEANDQRLTYNLWGEAMATAFTLQRQAASRTILVSQPIYEALQGWYNFSEGDDADTWILRQPPPNQPNP